MVSINHGTRHPKNPAITRRLLIQILLAGVVFLWFLVQFQLTSIFYSNSDVHEKQGDQTLSTKSTSTGDKDTTIDITNTNMTVGCLLVMDDNHRLVEWLAYHHFTMNLRYLVVAVDPRSTSSPEEILQRWTKYGLLYQIVTDDDYMGGRMLDKRKKLTELGRKHLTMVHRVRQKAFYQYCLEHLDATVTTGTAAANNPQKWTLLLDVDEYLVVNQDMVTRDMYSQAQSIMSTPGGMHQFIQFISQKASQLGNNDKELYKQFASPCVPIPRLLFGTTTANKSQTELRVQQSSPLSLPEQLQDRLDTQRWFYHAHFSEFDRNGLAKTILDLSRIEIPKPHFLSPVNPHRPFPDLCRDPKRIVDINDNAFLRIYHYLSTWETYSYRNDSRKGGERSREAWEFRALYAKEGPTKDAIPWLEGFVRYYGRDVATQLLEGAGLPTSYTHPPNVDRQWNFLFTQDFLDKANAQYESKFGRFLQNRTHDVKANNG